MKKNFYRLMENNEGSEGDTARPNPTEINARQNNSRLARMQAIANRVDGGRAEDFQDVDGETVTGEFQGGEFDDSPEAREAQALREEEEARVALEEEAARAEAENLQAEGAGEGDERTEGAGDGADAPEEKLINGVKHYLVLTPKGEKWLTFPQLKASAQKVESADEALQRANDAVKKATQLALAPREEPNDEGNDADVESIINSAVMGDREAIKSLASLLKTRPSKTPDVSREVAQAIATRSAVQLAEAQQKDIFEVEPLVPVFRARLTQVAQAEPELSIVAAYKKAGDMVRKEFAPMLKKDPTRPSKAERKRTLVNPPAQGSRQAPRADEDGEENPQSVIDQIAKGRGQARAIRHGRNLSSS